MGIGKSDKPGPRPQPQRAIPMSPSKGGAGAAASRSGRSVKGAKAGHPQKSQPVPSGAGGNTPLTDRSVQQQPSATETSYLPEFAQRAVTQIKSATSSSITGAAAFASSTTGNLLRTVGSDLYRGFSQTIPQFAAFMSATMLEGRLPETVEEEPTTRAILDLSAYATAQGFEKSAAITDRAVTQLADKLASITTGGIDKGIEMAPKLIYSTATQMLIRQVIQNVSKGTIDEYTAQTAAFLVSELLLQRIITGKVEFTDQVLLTTLGQATLNPTKDILTTYTLANLLSLKDLANNKPVRIAVKSALQQIFKRVPGPLGRMAGAQAPNTTDTT